MVSVKGRGEMGMLEGEVKIVGELLEHEFRLKAQQIFARASSSIAPVQSAMTAHSIAPVQSALTAQFVLFLKFVPPHVLRKSVSCGWIL
ncbi:hypothetical protein HPP92_016553 [Vanilla planifolia]|uniref:Uncharacterized protein n=1 Tax=Vanilla planifolia TaxID=51239 RepID=A0A835QND8_VANPL|nr:hypothetical protein HPP92_016553 [Vanilla planifolia]